MDKKVITLSIIILFLGTVYRLFLTSNDNFIFNMDNARDMVDVREMVVLHKLRLIGPRSAIEGLFNGPGWYYLLSIPFIFSGGDPYASIIMEIILWTIGGFFLLKLTSKFGILAMLVSGCLWATSDYIVLTNIYAFNPNPVTLLTPLFIYCLAWYLQTHKAFYVIFAWFLAGLFFNFEMNFGIFTPFIIFVSLLITKNSKFLKDKYFLVGVAIFVMALLPQIIFDFKHQFIMSKSVLRYFTEDKQSVFNPFLSIQAVPRIFYNTFLATLMNKKLLTLGLLFLSIPIFRKFLKSSKKDVVVLIALTYILVPFIGYLIIPVSVNPWHLGGPISASLILIAFVISKLLNFNFFGKIFSLVISFLVIYYVLSIANIHFIQRNNPTIDTAHLKNEIAAIDFVYKYSDGKNFKVYTYLPSVYDYPYQYLFWWYGKKEYGYLPSDYAYAPNKPNYISSKEKFLESEEDLKKRENSNLVFLIKEPDQNFTRPGWEGDFVKLETIEKQMIGPLEIEVRREFNK